MKEKKIVVSGVGCCLLDRIFNAVSFSSPRFQAYLSRRPSDGGLVPGKLEFEEEALHAIAKKAKEKKEISNFLKNLLIQFQISHFVVLVSQHLHQLFLQLLISVMSMRHISTIRSALLVSARSL